MDLSDDELKADVMYKLMRRCCWGGKYIPADSLVRWLSKRVKKNGKRGRNIIEQLINEGLLISHKKGKTISLNPARSGEIREFIRKYIG